MAVRGLRGAISVDENSREDIIARTEELLEGLVRKNDISPEDVASVVFSSTDDLDEEFPAVAAREMGWTYTPLFCCREIKVKGSLKGIVRVLMHVNSERKQSEMVHLYLGRAQKLRPDLEAGGLPYYSS